MWYQYIEVIASLQLFLVPDELVSSQFFIPRLQEYLDIWSKTRKTWAHSCLLHTNRGYSDDLDCGRWIPNERVELTLRNY